MLHGNVFLMAFIVYFPYFTFIYYSLHMKSTRVSLLQIEQGSKNKTRQNKLSSMSVILHMHSVKLHNFNWLIQRLNQIQVRQQYLKHDYTKF